MLQGCSIYRNSAGQHAVCMCMCKEHTCQAAYLYLDWAGSSKYRAPSARPPNRPFPQVTGFTAVDSSPICHVESLAALAQNSSRSPHLELLEPDMLQSQIMDRLHYDYQSTGERAQTHTELLHQWPPERWGIWGSRLDVDVDEMRRSIRSLNRIESPSGAVHRSPGQGQD